MTSALIKCTSVLCTSIEKFYQPNRSYKTLNKVEEIENKIDKEYMSVKLLVKNGKQMNTGIIIFDDLIEFIEQATDICVDTADYIITLPNRE